VIPNITRGGKTFGVLTYLIGKGREEEHANPTLIAGTVIGKLDDYEHGTPLATADVKLLAEWLDAPMRAFGKAPMRKGKPAHVWHCSLSLHPDEPAQTPETWQRIAVRYMEVMGWDAQDQDEKPRRQAQHHGEARWLAQHHGASKDGRDHIHIAANIVTEDGRQWNDYDDRGNSQEASAVIARELGLRLVDGQEQERGQRGVKPGELEADARRGLTVGEVKRTKDGKVARVAPGSARPENGTRRGLEQIVSACATAAVDERDFVQLLKEHGAHPRARWAKGGRDDVVGYSVAFPQEGKGDVEWVRFGGRTLGRDLALPALRAGWPELAPDVVADAWRNPRERTTLPPGSELLIDAEKAIAELRTELMGVDVRDRRAWSDAARDAAGVINTWSLRTEPVPGPLAEAAYALRASATVRSSAGERRRVLSRRAARLSANALITHKPARTSVELVRQVSYLTRQIVQMHQLDHQRERAHQLEVKALRAMIELEERTVAAGVGTMPRAAPKARIASRDHDADRDSGHER